MYLTLVKIMFVAVMATAFASCGREQGGTETSTDSRKASKPDDAPRAVDPLKDGY
jgi:hypothetical protein